MTEHENEVSTLRAEVAQLKARLDRLAHWEGSSGAPRTTSISADGSVANGDRRPIAGSRRQLLKLGGAAAVGAVGASLVGTSPADAATGDPLLLGNDNNADFELTEVASTSTVATFRADNTGSGDGLLGSADGAGAGVAATSTKGYGLTSFGALAPIWLQPSSGPPGPPATAFHNGGELFVDSKNALFGCVASGTPGTWVRLAGFNALNPVRMLDTRSSSPIGPNSSINLAVGGHFGVPTQASAVVVNATVTMGTAPSFLTIYPEGISRPLASNLNWVAGETIPNLVTVKLGTGGGITIYNAAGSVDVVLDLAGFYS